MKTSIVHSLAMASILTACPAISQNYPGRPVSIISPMPAGASPDVAIRAWMNCAEKITGQSFVLVNKPGANGVVAASALRTAPNDGHTVMLAGMSQMTITPYIFKKQPYDPEKEYIGAAIFATANLTLVASAESGIKSIADLVAYAAKRKEGIDIAIPAIASPAHLLSAAVAANLKLKATMVPLAGEAGGIVALIGGQMPVMILLTGSAAQYIESGKFIPLINFTPERLKEMPTVPTVGEALGDPSLARSSWIGIASKVGGPAPVTRSIAQWTQSCLQKTEFTDALNKAYFSPRFVSPEEYAAFIRKDADFWRPWIKNLAIEIN